MKKSKDYRFIKQCCLPALVMVVMTACGDSSNKNGDANTSPANAKQLVTVGGEAITAEQLEFAMDRTFSQVDKAFLNEEVKAKVLTSLIAAKAMKQAIAKELTSDDIAHITLSAQAYEEELYVKAYLSRKVVAEPVTTQMVSDYYQANQEKFGAVRYKTFEMVSVSSKLPEAERNNLMAMADSLAANKNWPRFVKKHQADLKLNYQQGRSIDAVLDKRLVAVIDKLAMGESSRLLFIDGLPVMVRLTGEDARPAKPIGEVSAEIRKQLAPLQLRKAVKSITEQLLSTADIERY